MLVTTTTIHNLAYKLSKAKAGARYGHKDPRVHPTLRPHERDLIVMALRHLAAADSGDVYLEEA